jgi:hypothetical protein
MLAVPDGIDRLARDARRGHIDFACVRPEAIVFLCDAGGAERVGFDDVGAGAQVLEVDLAHHVGQRQVQHIAIAAQVDRVVGETCAAVVGLAQAARLQHGAHGAVDHGDALLQQRGQCLTAGVGVACHG